MDIPSSLARPISPPRRSKRRKSDHESLKEEQYPTLAAVEAGKAKVDDHLAYFRDHLQKVWRDTGEGIARLSINEFTDLYRRNDQEHGSHFVIHQHNHPKAGVHYDLRLQFSQSSSISFAIPKGLPGNPNSATLGRMAIETRVHNFWNHLIESASQKTGSLLIFDTGTYTVLPRKMARMNSPSPQTTDAESETISNSGSYMNAPSAFASRSDTRHENEKLIEAFQARYIRLRLHGTRLPKNYTITLRLPSANDVSRTPAKRKIRRGNSTRKAQPRALSTDSDTESGVGNTLAPQEEHDEDLNTDEEEDTQTQIHNAYPGSTNSIGSIHQRRWFLSLDRQNSGFVQTTPIASRAGGKKGEWIRGDGGSVGFEPFFVRGRDFERSIVTGRLASEVESDEGVEGYVGRRGWVGIMH